MKLFKYLIIFSLYFNLISHINASIYHISTSGSHITEFVSFLYSAKSKVPHTAPGNGKPYIALDDATITVGNSDDGSYPFINILFYSNQAQEYIGLFNKSTGTTVDCCPPNQKDCEYGSIAIKGSKYSSVVEEKDYKIRLNQANGVDAFGYTFVANKSGTFKIPELLSDIVTTGIYGAIIMNCTTSSNYNLEGDIIFMNPYGYLSGDKFPFLNFNLILSALYVGLFVMWALLFFRFRDTALRIQFLVSFVILLGFLESMVNYIVYSSINKTGHFTTAEIVFMTIFSTLKNGFARALVVLVALGYGIIVPRLPKNVTIKLSIATAAYIVFKGIQDYLTKIPTTSNTSKVVMIYLTIPVVILDTLFYWWILFALIKNLEELNAKKQMIKLYMFRKFIWVLLASAIASFVILACQIYINSTQTFDYSIQTGWIIDVVWGSSYFVVLVAICWIWKPNSNNQKFAYSELNNADDDISMQSAGTFGNKNRNRSSNNNNDDDDDIESNIVSNDNVIEEIDGNANTFSINDDDDDDNNMNSRRNLEKTDIADMFSKL